VLLFLPHETGIPESSFFCWDEIHEEHDHLLVSLLTIGCCLSSREYSVNPQDDTGDDADEESAATVGTKGSANQGQDDQSEEVEPEEDDAERAYDDDEDSQESDSEFRRGQDQSDYVYQYRIQDDDEGSDHDNNYGENDDDKDEERKSEDEYSDEDDGFDEEDEDDEEDDGTNGVIYEGKKCEASFLVTKGRPGKLLPSSPFLSYSNEVREFARIYPNPFRSLTISMHFSTRLSRLRWKRGKRFSFLSFLTWSDNKRLAFLIGSNSLTGSIYFQGVLSLNERKIFSVFQTPRPPKEVSKREQEKLQQEKERTKWPKTTRKLP